MKRITCTVILGLTITGICLSQNPQRNVVLTLGEHETIEQNIAFTVHQSNPNLFSCIVWDTIKDTYTFLFNGKPIATSDYGYSKNGFCFYYLNLEEENGYIIESRNKAGKISVNIKGEKHDGLSAFLFAPYSKNFELFLYAREEGKQCKYYVYNKGVVEEGAFDLVRFDNKENARFLYRLDGKWYARYKDGSDKPVLQTDPYPYKENGKYYLDVNGVVSELPAPLHGIDINRNLWNIAGLPVNIQVTPNGKFAYQYRDSNKWYVYIKDEGLFGGYDVVDNLRIFENGDFVYRCRENGKWYVNASGEGLKGGYNFVSPLRILPNGLFAYSYSDKGKKYIYIKGEGTKGEYKFAGNIVITQNGKFGYSYKENRKWYVYFKNEDIKSGYKDVAALQLTESGKFAYAYKDKGKWYVCVKDEETRGGFEAVKTFEPIDYMATVKTIYLTQSGKFAYRYKESGKWHVYIKDEGVKGSYDEVESLRFTENGDFAYFYKDSGKWFVNIKGEEVGGGYEQVKNLRLLEDGKFAYAYKDNGKWRVNVKDENLPNEFDNVGWIRLVNHEPIAFSYQDSAKWYVYMGGSINGGYDAVGSLFYSINRKFAYSYYDGKNWFFHAKGEELTAGIPEYPSFYSSGGELAYAYWHDGMYHEGFNGQEQIIYLRREKVYQICSPGRKNLLTPKSSHVAINGQRYGIPFNVRLGKSPAIQVWYDEAKNAFIWNACEGKELTVYEYKLN